MPSVDSPYVLSLTGSLTTPRAEAIHAEVFAVVSGHPNVAIDCSNASEMDDAFIQTLVAAHRLAAQCGKTFALASLPSRQDRHAELAARQAPRRDPESL